MSVVAWDGRFLAADRCIISSGMRQFGSKMIATRIKDKPTTVIAWTGNHSQGIALARWYLGGEEPKKWPAFQSSDDWTRLIVASEGDVWCYEQLPEKIGVDDEFSAWGSGRDYAMGAMHMRASAKEAVEAACAFDINCWFGAEVHKAYIDEGEAF
jgi:hypothetical protein